jgi:MFS superfamily sulfate permease-like transporter
MERIASGVSGLDLRRGTQYDKIDEEELNRVNQELEDRVNRGTSFRKGKKEDGDLDFEQMEQLPELNDDADNRGSSVAVRKR